MFKKLFYKTVLFFIYKKIKRIEALDLSSEPRLINIQIAELRALNTRRADIEYKLLRMEFFKKLRKGK